MSGGSWNYLYQTMEDAADRLQNTSTEQECCEDRRVLGVLLRKVANAMHAIEWVDSCDYSSGDEVEPIKACFEHGFYKQATLQQLKSQVELLAEKISHWEKK